MRLIVIVLLSLFTTACVVVPVGGHGHKSGNSVLVCHKGKKTLELPHQAVDAHLNHGDRYGPC